MVPLPSYIRKAFDSVCRIFVLKQERDYYWRLPDGSPHQGKGQGIFIAPGYLLTAFHVVRDFKDAVVADGQARTCSISHIVAQDESLDLCIAAVDSVPSLNFSSPRILDTAPHSVTRGHLITHYSGKEHRYDGKEHCHELQLGYGTLRDVRFSDAARFDPRKLVTFHTLLTIEHGHSGSPIIDQTGQVISVLTHAIPPVENNPLWGQNLRYNTSSFGPSPEHLGNFIRGALFSNQPRPGRS
jgi:S1-C subfamily serine protease